MSTYAKLNLDVAIGQMLIVGFGGTAIEADSAIVRDIKKFHLGGTVLFDEDLGLGKLEKNIQNPSPTFHF